MIIRIVRERLGTGVRFSPLPRPSIVDEIEDVDVGTFKGLKVSDVSEERVRISILVSYLLALLDRGQVRTYAKLLAEPLPSGQLVPCFYASKMELELRLETFPAVDSPTWLSRFPALRVGKSTELIEDRRSGILSKSRVFFEEGRLAHTGGTACALCGESRRLREQ